jgi:hypothetical protein
VHAGPVGARASESRTAGAASAKRAAWAPPTARPTVSRADSARAELAGGDRPQRPTAECDPSDARNLMRSGTALRSVSHATRNLPRATGDAEQLLALFVEPAPRFMAIVRATPELEIVYSRLPTACDRLDMVQFQKRG